MNIPTHVYRGDDKIYNQDMEFMVVKWIHANLEALEKQFVFEKSPPALYLVFDGSQEIKDVMEKRGERLRYRLNTQNWTARLKALKQSGLEGFRMEIKHVVRRKTTEEIREANRGALEKLRSWVRGWLMFPLSLERAFLTISSR